METFIGGFRRRTSLEIDGLRRQRTGQMVATLGAEIQTCFQIPKLWIIRRSDDRLFACGADYADPRGPSAHHRFFTMSDKCQTHVLARALPTLRDEIEGSGPIDETDHFLLEEQQYIQPFEHVDLLEHCKDLADSELIEIHRFVLLPKPFREVVGYMHFRFAGLMTIWDCPIVLRRGVLYVTSPYDRGSLIRPVKIEDAFRKELTMLMRQRMASNDYAVPAYLRGPIAALRMGETMFEVSECHDRLSVIGMA